MRLFGKPVCHIPALLLCFLFVCLFVFKPLCSLREHFFNTFGTAWTFQELQGAETSFCLPVKGVSSLKGDSLLKNHRICKKKEKLAKIHRPVGTRRRSSWGAVLVLSNQIDR